MNIRFSSIWIWLICLLPLNLLAQGSYVLSLQHHRDSLDAHFKSDSDSPLDSADRMNFKGLHYFDIDSNYRVTVTFEKKKRGKRFLMKTTTDRMPEYKVYGTLYFDIQGQKLNLTVYQNIALSKKKAYKDYLFCPFKDLTNGNETYGGGRYMDFRMGDLEKGVVDFNLSYNPYCAYNHRYSCPIPPIENHLKIPIYAGVMIWDAMGP